MMMMIMMITMMTLMTFLFPIIANIDWLPTPAGLPNNHRLSVARMLLQMEKTTHHHSGLDFFAPRCRCFFSFLRTCIDVSECWCNDCINTFRKSIELLALETLLCVAGCTRPILSSLR